MSSPDVLAMAQPSLLVAMGLFALGLLGVITSRHLIRMLMCVELMLNAVNLVLIALNNAVGLTGASGDWSGQIFALFILTIAAVEAAVGLALVMAYVRQHGSVDVASLSRLKG